MVARVDRTGGRVVVRDFVRWFTRAEKDGELTEARVKRANAGRDDICRGKKILRREKQDIWWKGSKSELNRMENAGYERKGA